MKTQRLLVTASVLNSLFCAAYPACAQTWTQTSAPITNWGCIAASATGRTLVAGVGGSFGPFVGASGPIYTSTNAGTTWTLTGAPLERWFSVACSADGTVLAAVAHGGGIHVSTNSGGTWV